MKRCLARFTNYDMARRFADECHEHAPGSRAYAFETMWGGRLAYGVSYWMEIAA